MLQDWDKGLQDWVQVRGHENRPRVGGYKVECGMLNKVEATTVQATSERDIAVAAC